MFFSHRLIHVLFIKLFNIFSMTFRMSFHASHDKRYKFLYTHTARYIYFASGSPKLYNRRYTYNT